jgi:hypothetical protein
MPNPTIHAAFTASSLGAPWWLPCNDGAPCPGPKLTNLLTNAPSISIIIPPLQPPQLPWTSSHILPTVNGVPFVLPMAPPISDIPPTADKVPCASSAVLPNQTHPDSPIRFSLPSEEDVFGLEEDVLGFQITNFPPGLLSLQCTSAKPQCTVADLGLQDNSWAEEIRAQFPEQMRLQDSLVHIVGRPGVCGLFGDGTMVCAFTTTDNTPSCSLCDSGANLCMTNSPNLLVDVHPCAPFMILLATSDGGHSHTNVCQCRGLLPLPLVNGTTYYQTCFVNPYALETFILPQAIIDSSGG